MILGTRFAWNTIKPVCRSLNCCVNGGRVCGRGAAGSSPTPPVFTLRCRLATCYGEKKKKKKSTAKIALKFLSSVCGVSLCSQPAALLQHFNTECFFVFASTQLLRLRLRSPGFGFCGTITVVASAMLSKSVKQPVTTE